MYQDVSLLEMNHINFVSLPFPEVYAGFSILVSASDGFFFLVFVYTPFKIKHFSQICFLANV